MDAAHFHLIINHFPMVGIVIGLFMYGHGLFHKQQGVTNTALLLFGSLTVFAIATYVSGEEAEEIVESIASISHEGIHRHEEIAELGLWMSLILGFCAIVTLYVSNKMEVAYTKWLHTLTLLLAVASLVTLAYVNYTGGQISHVVLQN